MEDVGEVEAEGKIEVELGGAFGVALRLWRCTLTTSGV
jgi:hypothetical protein